MKRTCTTVIAVQITSNFQKVLQCNTSSIQHPPLLNSDRRFTRWCVACTGSDTCEVHPTFLRPLSLFIRLGFFCQADSMKTAELRVLNYCTQCQNAHIAPCLPLDGCAPRPGAWASRKDGHHSGGMQSLPSAGHRSTYGVHCLGTYVCAQARAGSTCGLVRHPTWHSVLPGCSTMNKRWSELLAAKKHNCTRLVPPSGIMCGYHVYR